jgi:hypothetical protein
MLRLLFLFALLLSSANCGDDPVVSVPVHYVEVIERNTVLGWDGTPHLEQWILWGRHPDYFELQICEWWVHRGDKVTKAGGWYVMSFWRGEQLHVIKSKGYKRSWTLHDPELISRDWLPKEKRMLLWSRH